MAESLFIAIEFGRDVPPELADAITIHQTGILPDGGIDMMDINRLAKLSIVKNVITAIETNQDYDP